MEIETWQIVLGIILLVLVSIAGVIVWVWPTADIILDITHESQETNLTKLNHDLKELSDGNCTKLPEVKIELEAAVELMSRVCGDALLREQLEKRDPEVCLKAEQINSDMGDALRILEERCSNFTA